jgi:hypothetical protein
MRHTDAISKVGGVLGIQTDCLPEIEITSLERAFDEVFEAGYQAGLNDRNQLTMAVDL